ncbi:MAG: MerR family transcriptional regulator [Aestuariibacter sp.]
MRIGELAKQAGLTASTIRYYESLGLLPKAQRSQSGYRQYNAHTLDLLQLIRLGQSLGFSLEELPKLISSDSKLDHQLILAKLQTKQAELTQMIGQLQSKQRQLDALQATLNEYWQSGQCLPQAELIALLDKN